MKKIYIVPQSSEVTLQTEEVLLSGSIQVSIDEAGNGEDDVFFESNQRGWSSDAWTANED